MNKVASELVKIAKSLISAELPSHMEKFVDEYETDDYPYGRFRTKAKWVVEGNQGKQRISRVTVDPKTGRVNAPKKTTYGNVAKIGIANNRTYLFIGSPNHISAYDGAFMSVGSIFPDNPQFKYYAENLGMEEVSAGIHVKKIENGAVISGYSRHKKQFTPKELMLDAGLSQEDIGQVLNLNRKTSFTEDKWTVKFKPEVNRPDFVIVVDTN